MLRKSLGSLMQVGGTPPAMHPMCKGQLVITASSVLSLGIERLPSLPRGWLMVQFLLLFIAKMRSYNVASASPLSWTVLSHLL